MTVLATSVRAIWAVVIALCVVGATARQVTRELETDRKGDHVAHVMQRTAARVAAGRRTTGPELRSDLDVPATVAAPTARRSCAVLAGSVRGAPPATLAIAAVRSRGPPHAA